MTYPIRRSHDHHDHCCRTFSSHSRPWNSGFLTCPGRRYRRAFYRTSSHGSSRSSWCGTSQRSWFTHGRPMVGARPQRWRIALRGTHASSRWHGRRWYAGTHCYGCTSVFATWFRSTTLLFYWPWGARRASALYRLYCNWRCPRFGLFPSRS